MTEKQLMTSEDIRRALTRVAHEIVEGNPETQTLMFVGIHTRGVPLAHRLAALLMDFAGISTPVGALDIGLYRDDLAARTQLKVQVTDFPVDIDDKSVVLVDDVLFTGRSVRAAMDALIDLGRPRLVRLAVLVDRGHRQLPVRPDYVGRNFPTAVDQRVNARLSEIDGLDEVVVTTSMMPLGRVRSSEI